MNNPESHGFSCTGSSRFSKMRQIKQSKTGFRKCLTLFSVFIFFFIQWFFNDNEHLDINVCLLNKVDIVYFFARRSYSVR